MLPIRVLTIFALYAALPSPSFAQDDCWDPTPISGLGSWALDNTNATASGFMGCGVNMWRDVFYQWTVPQTGGYTFETCGTSGDTVMALYSGVGCTATCLRFNDDGCGTASEINFGQLQAGDDILIQIGAKDHQSNVVGQFSIRCLTASNDECDNPFWFWGKGIFPLDNRCATSSGIDPDPASLCDATPLYDDVFYMWVPTYSGAFWVGSQATSPTADTVIRVYQYTDCNNLVCVGADDDDGPGGLSQVHLPQIPLGYQYLIQVGSNVPGGGVEGILVVDDNPCAVLTNDAFSPNQECWTAAPLSNGTYSNLAVGPNAPDLFVLTVEAGSTLGVQTSTDSWPVPLDLALYAAGQCPTPIVAGCAGALACGQSISANGVRLLWSNSSPSPVQVTLRIMPPPGTTCLGYSMAVGGSGGQIGLACSPGLPNSTGLAVSLTPSSFTGLGLFHLEAINGPADQFAYFVVSSGLNPGGILISQGRLCLAAPMGRYEHNAGSVLPARNSVSQFNAEGILINLMGTSSVGTGFDVPADLPTPPGGVILPGETWHFQLWYRDGIYSNFSDVLSVTF